MRRGDGVDLLDDDLLEEFLDLGVGLLMLGPGHQAAVIEAMQQVIDRLPAQADAEFLLQDAAQVLAAEGADAILGGGPSLEAVSEPRHIRRGQAGRASGLSQEGGFPGGSLWTISIETCSIVCELTPISIDGGSPMSTITQRIASAFVVLCGRYGDVTKMAHDREQSRQSLYREASQVANAVDGTAVQSRIDELQRQLAGQQAQIQDLQERLEHAIEITRDKQDEFASVAQAEGVSLSMARRLLQVVAGSVTTPSVPTLGRATEEAGQRAGQLLEVIDEVAQPKVKQATADEIFLGPNRS